VVQGALKLILEPIFEADFQPGSYGYRPRRTAHKAVDRVAKAIFQEKTRVLDLDLRAYFDNVQHYLLLEKVAQRIQDDDVMRLLKMILKATGKKGAPQGGVIPVLSNLYLNEVDRTLDAGRSLRRAIDRPKLDTLMPTFLAMALKPYSVKQVPCHSYGTVAHRIRLTKRSLAGSQFSLIPRNSVTTTSRLKLRGR
jgi:retron-type reverse transcriptase